jgi:NADPH-dependent glutamate synthase beta subunit-like oxidoreductase
VGVKFAEVKSIEFNEEGRIKPILLNGREHVMDGNSVIIAIGQSVDQSFLDGVKGLKVNKKGTIVVASDSLATNLPGVFAGGDVVSGSGTVIEAIAAGHKAALSIDRYLCSKETKEIAGPDEIIEVEEERLPRFVKRRERGKMPKLSVKERVSSFKEVELGFGEAAAVNEAERCLSCPICGNCIFDRSQLCYETAVRLL